MQFFLPLLPPVSYFPCLETVTVICLCATFQKNSLHIREWEKVMDFTCSLNIFGACFVSLIFLRTCRIPLCKCTLISLTSPMLMVLWCYQFFILISSTYTVLKM